MDLEMKKFASPSEAKVNIKFHQFFADTQLPINRVHTNIEKLGFICHIPKTDKTDHRLFGSLFHLHHKTIGKRISHFLHEHILRPRGERVGNLYGQDLV
jgi:hypothetical protein